MASKVSMTENIGKNQIGAGESQMSKGIGG
jgi:hypothetical protein